MRWAYGPTRWLNAFWWWFRQVTGDAAYENYLGRSRQADFGGQDRSGGLAGDSVLSEREFYLDRIRRRYARISRCC
jgi:uncharacterized short protein YbdD (DUF466 family)